jgi:hypothetical protein
MLCSSAKFGNGVSIGLIDEIDAKKIRHRKSFRQTAFSGKLIVHVSCPDVIFRASISTLDRAGLNGRRGTTEGKKEAIKPE